MLAGVCAGIAARWGFDVTLVRVAAAVLGLLSGLGVAAYVAAWLLTPSSDGPAPLSPDSRVARAVSGHSGRWLRRLPALVLVVLLALAVAAVAHHLWLGPPAGVVVLAAVAIVIVGTRLGRWALVAVAGLMALALATVGVLGPHLGTRSFRVTAVGDLQSSYDFGVGAVRLDLSQLPTLSGRHETRVRLGRGAVTVTVPRTMPVVVHARAGVGSVTVDGHRVTGFDAEQSAALGGTSGTSAGTLVVDVTVGAGSVTVR
jgi:phage shock protein PspC (stress-responsive transcriptional regulator)